MRLPLGAGIFAATWQTDTVAMRGMNTGLTLLSKTRPSIIFHITENCVPDRGFSRRGPGWGNRAMSRRGYDIFGVR